MNIIEQLGGYEKLKPHFALTDRVIGYTHVYLNGNNHYCFLDERVDYIIPDRAILIKDVFDALLEYRRQQNIFEVGDKVVFRKCSGIGGASDVIDLMTVKSIDAFGVRMTNSLCPWAIQIRHATDEEIKAGKRL